MKTFKNRKKELQALSKVVKSNKFEFSIVYGRRRVGKTALHLEAISGSTFIYFMARKSNNVKKFKEQCIRKFPETKMISEDFESLFQFLKDRVDCIIIDEFPNLLEENQNFLNIFQVIVDSIIADSSLSLFILGSSISVMKSKIMSNSSPLFGRKTFSFKLQPLDFYQLLHFFPDSSLNEIIEIFGMTGGIPYYINRIDIPFWDWLDQELEFPVFIRDEGTFIVRYEFISSGRYFSILEAIAFGNCHVNEISQYTNIKATSLSQYLKNLELVEFIVREIPVTEKPGSKRGIYVLKDNFLKFWFRFIYPNMESLDQGILSVEELKSQYSHYMGSIFVKVVKQFLIEYREHFSLNKFTKIGRWWWRDNEIDLIAYHPLKKKATLVECKWSEGVDARQIVSHLIKKEKYIRYKGQNQDKEHDIMIFAKSFSKKVSSFGEYTVICVDLPEMEKIIRINKEL